MGVGHMPWRRSGQSLGHKELGTWEASVLLNQVHTPECSKASRLTPGAVKERAALMVKAPVRGDRDLVLYTLRSLKGFRKAVLWATRWWGGWWWCHRVCDSLVHGSLAGEVTGG